MSDINLNAAIGPKYEVNLQTDSPIKLSVGIALSNGANVVSGTTDVAVVAAEVVNAYHAIGYDGLFTQQTEDSLSRYAGVTRVATAIGDTAYVVRSGLLTEAAWNWTVDEPVFISNGGVITQALPVGVVRRIGWAISATKINLDLFPIIGV